MGPLEIVRKLPVKSNRWKGISSSLIPILHHHHKPIPSSMEHVSLILLKFGKYGFQRKRARILHCKLFH
ncbi:hypothetical protein QQP08_004557 [Theobroma cacao]|nr:hypothetical protein QQP08_004557 [Theobroma cacao]